MMDLSPKEYQYLTESHKGVHLTALELQKLAKRPLAEVFKYDPEQPRVPRGSAEGGQFTTKQRLANFMVGLREATTANPFDPSVRVTPELAGIEARPWEGGIHLSAIISFAPKGEGVGTKAVTLLTSLADKHGVKLTATVKPIPNAGDANTPSLTKRQLHKWYAKHGFKTRNHGGDFIFRQPTVQKYSKDQLRHPKGHPNGGEWAPSYSAALRAGIDKAYNVVVAHGNKTGNEMYVLIGPDGQHLHQKAGKKTSVEFDLHTKELIATKGAGIILVHNHPRLSALSIPDYTTTINPGLDEIIAIGADGATNRVVSQGSIKGLPKDITPSEGNLLSTFFAGAAEVAWDAPHKILQEAVNETALEVWEASALHSYVVAAALAKAGMVDHSFTEKGDVLSSMITSMPTKGGPDYAGAVRHTADAVMGSSAYKNYMDLRDTMNKVHTKKSVSRIPVKKLAWFEGLIDAPLPLEWATTKELQTWKKELSSMAMFEGKGKMMRDVNAALSARGVTAFIMKWDRDGLSKNLIAKYNPDQPREPKGTSIGGRFARAGRAIAAFFDTGDLKTHDFLRTSLEGKQLPYAINALLLQQREKGLKRDASLLGMNDEFSAATKAVREVLKGGELTVNVHGEDTLNQILNDGRFKTQHETGFSGGGLLHPEHRHNNEAILFGYKQRPEDGKLPIYGYLEGPEGGSRVDIYGDIQIKLKDSVRDRATVTAGDSLSSENREPRLIPSTLRIPSMASAIPVLRIDDTRPRSTRDYLNRVSGVRTLADLRALEDTPYVEVQIHNGVSASEIAKVVVPSSGTLSRITLQRLRDQGIEYEVADRVQKYNENQPREPKGTPIGGRFAGVISGPKTHTMWHLTANPQFALNSSYTPEVNTTMGSEAPPGLYVARELEPWVNGYGYVRPFAVELRVTEDLSTPDKGMYAGERFIPAERFKDIEVARVIPLDAYARETFGDYGWLESWQEGSSFSKRLPQAESQYSGPDVRDMAPEQQKKYIQLAEDYLRTTRPQNVEKYSKDQPREPKGTPIGGRFAKLPFTGQLKDIMDSGKYQLVYESSLYQWPSRTELASEQYQIWPKEIPKGWIELKDKYGKTEYIDPEVASAEFLSDMMDMGTEAEPRMVDTGYVKATLNDGWSRKVPAESKEGVLYRGMSAEEFENFKKDGYFQSREEFNIGAETDTYAGVTYYSTDPKTADFYAHGFAPMQFKAAIGKPAYVVAIKDPGTAREEAAGGNNERAIPGKVGKEMVLEVFEGRLFHVQAGGVTLLTPDQGLTTVMGSAQLGIGDVAWRKISESAYKAFKEQKYDKNQPRDPKGTSTGGQWSAGTGSAGSEARALHGAINVNHGEIGIREDDLYNSLIHDIGDNPIAKYWFATQIKEGTDAEKMKELFDQAEDNLTKVLSEAAVMINVAGLPTLVNIARNGRLKSQFETKTSQGMLDPAYRRAHEWEMFGIGSDPNDDEDGTIFPNEERPIYGHLGDVGDSNPEVTQYGRFQLTLKDSVQDRVTVTGNDSLRSNDMGVPTLIPSPMLDPQPTSFLDLEQGPESNFAALVRMTKVTDVQHLRRSMNDRSPYIEAQIHGGVRLSDIQSIKVPKDRDIANMGRRGSGASDVDPEVVYDLYRDAGVDIIYYTGLHP